MIDGADVESPDPDAVVRRIRDRAASIRDREVRRAVDRLEATGGHTDPHCETVRALGESLTASLIGPTVAAIRNTEDEETLATAVELFEE